MKGKIIKIISPNYTFLPANLIFLEILNFASEFFQTEFVDAYRAMPEKRGSLLLFAIP